MKALRVWFILFLVVQLQGCGIMPPRRQYIKEANQQVIPTNLLNTHWILESWKSNQPDCILTMDLYEKGRFNFKWNELDFEGDELWYIVTGNTITFHTRPIEKIVWTTKNYKLTPDIFALYLEQISKYEVKNDKLTLMSNDDAFVFKRRSL